MVRRRLKRREMGLEGVVHWYGFAGALAGGAVARSWLLVRRASVNAMLADGRSAGLNAIGSHPVAQSGHVGLNGINAAGRVGFHDPRTG